MATMHRLVWCEQTEKRALLTPPPPSSPPRMRMVWGVPGWVAHGDVLCPLPHPEGLLATNWREDLDATTHRRGGIDQGCRAIEGIRCETVPPASGVWRLERLQ